MNKDTNDIYKSSFLTGDILALVIAFLISMTIRFGYKWENIQPQHWLKWYIFSFGIIILLNILIMYFYRLYDMNYRFILSQIPKIIQAFLYSILIFFIAMFFIRDVQFSRLTFVYYAIVGIPMLIVFRFIVNRYIKKLFEKGVGVKSLIFIDFNETNNEILEHLIEHREFGIKVCGGLSKNGIQTGKFKILGMSKDYEEIISANKIDIVLVSNYNESVKDIVTYCENNYIQIFMIPDVINMVSNPVDIGYINSIPLITFRESRLTSTEGKFKRIFDFALGILGFMVLSPFMIVIAILIKISSPGSVIFKHKRLGMNGKYIYVYKFRTMLENADGALEKLFQKHPEMKLEYEKEFKLENDPRITGIGKFLRETSLDELPQLLNIIKGELSIVGPRPIVEKEIEKYGEYCKYILRVPPGLTGLWQVSGRSDISYNDRIQLDMYYINNWTFMLDIMILLKTIPAVLAKRGAR